LLATMAAVLLLMGVERLPAHTSVKSGGNRVRGGGDPAQSVDHRMERYREQLEVTSDEEWRVIQRRVEKVMQTKRELQVGGYGITRRGSPASGAQFNRASNRGGRGNRGARYTVESNPDVAALQKVVDSKASAAEIKAQLARLRETLKQKEADLVKAQEELREVLTARQEAIAVLTGLLR